MIEYDIIRELELVGLQHITHRDIGCIYQEWTFRILSWCNLRVALSVLAKYDFYKIDFYKFDLNVIIISRNIL